jgi:hypothetical protein
MQCNAMQSRTEQSRADIESEVRRNGHQSVQGAQRKKRLSEPTSHMMKKMGPRLFFGSRNVFCIVLNMLLVECDS